MMKNSMKKMIVLALMFTMVLGVFQAASVSIATAATTREDLATFKKGLDWLSANCGRSYFIRGDGYKQNVNSTVKDAVKALQRLLRAMGHNVAVDGGFGKESYNAVKEVQKTLGITSDGLPGMATYEALEKFFTATSHGYRILYPAEGTYTISYAGNENYGLAVEGGSTDAQARILLDLAGTKVVLKHVGNGWYKVLYASNPNLLVNVMNGYNGLDGRLWLYPDDNTDACLFRFLDAGNGHVIIESKLGTVIDLDNGNAFAGALVHMWSLPCYCEWVLKPVGTNPADLANATHEKQGSRMCVLTSIAMLVKAELRIEGKPYDHITQSTIYAYNGNTRPAYWDRIAQNANKNSGTTRKMTSVTLSGSGAARKQKLIDMLSGRPEGVVAYFYKNGSNCHAVRVCGYDAASDTFYVSDPGNSSYKYVSLQQSYIGNGKYAWGSSSNAFSYLNRIVYYQH